MKKTAKSILLLLIIAMLTITLTGCGDSDKEKSDSKKSSENKIVAVLEEESSPFGDYTETVEATLKDDVVSKVTITMDFKDEDAAKEAAETLEYMYDVEIKGKKVTVELEPGDFFNDEDVSKEDAEEYFEDHGYKIK